MAQATNQDRSLDPGAPLAGVLVRVLVPLVFVGPDHKRLPDCQVGDLIRVAGDAYVTSLEADGYVTRDWQSTPDPAAEQDEELVLSPEEEKLIDENPLLYLVGEDDYNLLRSIGVTDKGSIRMMFMREGVVPFMKVIDAETTEAVLLWAGEMEEIIAQRISENTTVEAAVHEWYNVLHLTEPQIAVLSDAHLTNKPTMREFLDLNGIAGLTRMRHVGVVTAEKLATWAGWTGDREPE